MSSVSVSPMPAFLYMRHADCNAIVKVDRLSRMLVVDIPTDDGIFRYEIPANADELLRIEAVLGY
jgi:hypothetical protein